ncbi:hypothetical protein [Amycolatopsis sp. cmx-4-83]|uniref:hypothetical protein n=1 Tax=Amycolatopsis sp. cmx-4-83 TaxID=2790940 RepID=UPI00397A002A
MVSEEGMDQFADRLSAAITAGIQAGELGEDTSGMPAGFVLVATYYDSTGDMRTALTVNNGARTHETLGLLALGTAVWEDEARAWVRGE